MRSRPAAASCARTSSMYSPRNFSCDASTSATLSAPKMRYELYVVPFSSLHAGAAGGVQGGVACGARRSAGAAPSVRWWSPDVLYRELAVALWGGKASIAVQFSGIASEINGTCKRQSCCRRAGLPPVGRGA